jgi:RHS repeat-associated protein
MPYSSNWNVVQENEYYPFGMPYPTAGYYPEAQPYKFGGKEMDEMNGLKWYDFEARQKGTVLPPFTTRDPLAEKYYNISPYAYCNNNPVRFVDPDGRDWKDKVMGAVIGIATNVVPLSTGLRNLYSPNDAADYNNTLQAVDNTAMAVGTLMMIDGGIDIAAGQGVATAGAAITVGSGGTGAEVGVPVAGAGEVISGIGVAKVATGAVTLFNGANNASQGYDYGGKNNASSGNSNTSNTSKPSTQTSSGQAADKHGNKLGPSGKPQVNKVTLSSQKQAKDAARSNGDGKPVKHSSPSKGNSHYHPTDKDGQKIPNSTHYEYPK